MLSLDISLFYPGFALALRETIPPVGVTALFGRSGSGKSSLLRVIAGLERAAKGRVAWGDEVWQDANHFTPPHKRGLGYVFQDTRLFAHLTVQGNLAYADTRAKGLPGPGLTEVIAALDLAPLLTRSPATLSGGEASRVAIGRALLTRPKLLLMDEPLAALDEDRRAEILPYLERLRDDLGIAMLYVSHSTAEVARLANHLLLIEGGKIRLRGAASALLADPATAPAFGLREAGAVLQARIDAQEDDGLTRLTTGAGPVLLPRVDAPKGTPLRLRILARDVMIALARPENISALNVLPVTVSALRIGDGPGALVQLRAGDETLLARITRRSVTALGLKPGTACFAVIKSVSVAPGDIGSPGQRAKPHELP
jgi:molybdate transport system ATP-binding protein